MVIIIVKVNNLENDLITVGVEPQAEGYTKDMRFVKVQTTASREPSLI